MGATTKLGQKREALLFLLDNSLDSHHLTNSQNWRCRVLQLYSSYPRKMQAVRKKNNETLPIAKTTEGEQL